MAIVADIFKKIGVAGLNFHPCFAWGRAVFFSHRTFLFTRFILVFAGLDFLGRRNAVEKKIQ